MKEEVEGTRMNHINPDNKYSKMQKNHYDNDVLSMCGNHAIHNDNPDYWDILLAPIRSDPSAWNGKKVLDFGCGHGRNMINMAKYAVFSQVDGVDISANNLVYAKANFIKEYPNIPCNVYENNGVDLSTLKTQTYDFIMSTIVLQHICVHDIRFSLLKDMYRILNFDGILSIQMGYGLGKPSSRDYFENFYDAHGTNSSCDTRVESADQLLNELKEIGFKKFIYHVRPPWDDQHANWLYVRCEK